MRVDRQFLVRLPGQVKLLVQCAAKRVDTVEVERQPHAQPAEVARQFRTVVGEVGQAGAVEILEIVDVRAAEACGGSVHPRAANWSTDVTKPLSRVKMPMITRNARGPVVVTPLHSRG